MPKGNPNKSYLPSKLCIVCSRPFTWRKKWAKNWNEVKYCSDKCRGSKPPLTPKGEQNEKMPLTLKGVKL
jgi:hypothetical protein